MLVTKNKRKKKEDEEEKKEISSTSTKSIRLRPKSSHSATGGTAGKCCLYGLLFSGKSPADSAGWMVAFSSLAKILEECSTIHSPPAFFFFFLCVCVFLKFFF